MALLFISMIFVSNSSVAINYTDDKEEVTPMEVIELKDGITVEQYEMFDKYSKIYGANFDDLIMVAKCESRYKHENLYGDKGTSYGIFQYQAPTFKRYSSLMGEELNYKSEEDQIKLTAFIFAKHPEERKAWTTWVAYTKGGSYTFYSGLTNKKHTAFCNR